MSFKARLASLQSRQWPRRCIPWVGGLLIAIIAATAVYDIARGYRLVVSDTRRELDSQARVIAEQTARAMQAVDFVLRHIALQFQKGALAGQSEEELGVYLKEQAVGLVQLDGLAIVDASGSGRAASFVNTRPTPNPDLTTRAYFRALRDDRNIGVVVDGALRSEFDQRWIFPIARRLETPAGEFAGVIVARGRIDYFHQFYRDVRLEPGTNITLMHHNGTLLARYPQVESALGQRFPLFDELLAARVAGEPASPRGIRPIDGVDRFGSTQLVADYPLAVIVTRDAAVAFAAWRTQSSGTIIRTLALGILAALLLALVMRQFSRLHRTQESLEEARERFCLAVDGSDDGIWDVDLITRTAFESARGRELLGLPPGPDKQPLDDWLAAVQLHPDDAPRNAAALEGHLAGHAPAYEGEFRFRHQNGSYRWARIRGVCVRDATGKPYRMAGSVSDIDARKRTEESLRLSEERYSLAMTGSSEGHWVWDVASDAFYASGKLNEIYGFPIDFKPASQSEYFARLPIHPDDKARVAKFKAEQLAGDSSRFEFEFRIVVSGTGEVRWVQARGQCFRNAQGKPERLAGSTVDITKRKFTEEALRESEERLALTVAGSNDGILDWDMVSDCMFTSKRAMSILGVDSDVTVRKRSEWKALLNVHPDDRQRYDDDSRRHAEGLTDIRDGEYRFRHPDGVYRWVRVRGMSVRDAAGNKIRWAGSASDIDTLKQTEQALRQSEERYQLAVAGSNEGLWDWDLASDRMFLSARAQELLWHTAGEPQRQRREWIARTIYHPDDLEVVRTAISDHLRGRTAHFRVEYRLQHHSGDWRWYRQRGIALRDAEGHPYRMAGSMEDITDRKTAEAERDRLAGQLLQAKKLEAMGTLAGGIAHDFNNILAAILGYGEMAQKQSAEGTALRRHIDAAMSAGMRAKSLVERILAFSRSGMGERVAVHVQSVVTEALDLIAASLPSGVRLERRLAVGDAAVLGDPTQVHQVVMNLCANAVQSMKSTGTLTVSLELEDLTGPVCATCNLASGNYVRLSVRDTGTGIAPQLLERIFDPFFTTKEVGVGTGLGLSLVHGIVSDLGGGIDVESRVGEGSTFTVFLPWQSSIAPRKKVEESIPNGTGETILLVDDEEALVRLGEEMIAELGYEPVGFTSSAAALATFRAAPDRFNAVLSDEAMPDMTGSELAKEIRRIRSDIPIVLMSGFVTSALSTRARAAGVVDVLAKPLVARDIARSLASALRH